MIVTHNLYCPDFVMAGEKQGVYNFNPPEIIPVIIDSCLLFGGYWLWSLGLKLLFDLLNIELIRITSESLDSSSIYFVSCFRNFIFYLSPFLDILYSEFPLILTHDGSCSLYESIWEDALFSSLYFYLTLISVLFWTL